MFFKILLSIIVIFLGLVVFFSFFHKDSTRGGNDVDLDVCENLYGLTEVSVSEYERCLERGYACELGYSEKREVCCDEDDYSCEECNSNKYDCSDFPTQWYAQDMYYLCKDFKIGVTDIHRLDGDNDGLVCESYKYDERTP